MENVKNLKKSKIRGNQMYKPKYFKAYELVSKAVYNRFGDTSIKFMDKELLMTLDVIREYFGKPVNVNNWKTGGGLSQRGFRENISQIVKDKTAKGTLYLSAHTLGKGVDFHINGLSPREIVDGILSNRKKFPFITRIEDPRDTPTWVHIDVMHTGKDGVEIFRG